jgi:hypothetical protein
MFVPFSTVVPQLRREAESRAGKREAAPRRTAEVAAAQVRTRVLSDCKSYLAYGSRRACVTVGTEVPIHPCRMRRLPQRWSVRQ